MDLAAGPVGLLEEYELLAPFGASDHKAVQVWLGGWQAKPEGTVEKLRSGAESTGWSS